MLEMFNVASPVFVRVTACAGLVVPTFWEPKVSELTDVVATGPIPIPLKFVTGELPAVLLPNEIQPVKLPRVTGLKVTAILHDAPTARLVPQLFV